MPRTARRRSTLDPARRTHSLLTTHHSRLMTDRYHLTIRHSPLPACALSCRPYLDTRRAEAAGAARGRRDHYDLDEPSLLDALHDELGEALAARDHEGLPPQVGEQHLHLAAVVAVDGAGAVEHGDAVSQR